MPNRADPDQFGFFRCQLIWIYTVCKGRAYPGSAGPGLNASVQIVANENIKILFEPVQPWKTQISLHIYAVWSESALMCLPQSPGYLQKGINQKGRTLAICLYRLTGLCWSHRSYCRFCRPLTNFWKKIWLGMWIICLDSNVKIIMTEILYKYLTNEFVCKHYSSRYRGEIKLIFVIFAAKLELPQQTRYVSVQK